MTMYVFGVMSNKFSCESESLDIAKVAMAVHMNTSAPIVIYSPDALVFCPTKVLEQALNHSKYSVVLVKECISSIKIKEGDAS